MANAPDINPSASPPAAPKRRRRRVIMAVVLLAIGLGFLIHALTAVKEPIYQGKRLSVWLDDTYQTKTGHRTGYALTAASVQAVRTIGTNALPYLFKMLEARDSNLKLAVVQIMRRKFQIYLPTSYNDHRRAMDGFRALGPAAKPAYPELVKLTLNTNSNFNGFFAIDSLMEADADTISMLTNGLQSSDRRVRCQAALALGYLRQAPAISLPALTRALADPDSNVRIVATDALGYYGPQAKSAIPALSGLTNAANPNIRNTALGVIDVINIDTNIPDRPSEKKE